jgi:small subunit ribosomal protein S4e
MKRLAAPNHWMLDKLGGTWAPKPAAGPHKSRECLPLVILLRNRLNYALTAREVKIILMERKVKVDGKVRVEPRFPCGFMDVVSIPETNEHFRLLYNVKGRFHILRIKDDEATYKLGLVKRVDLGAKGIPRLVTHDGRTIRYPDPDIKVHDTVKIDLATGKIVDHVKFDVGNLCMLIGGKNLGRIGVIERREKHHGSYEIVHVKDAANNKFATRLNNVFVIGKGFTSLVSVPSNKGVKLTILEERERKLAQN